jgi:quinol monooxygenase YgiN
MIIILGRAEADPARLPELRGALTEMMRATFEESGCLSYSLAIEHEGGNGHPAVITISERWESEASLKDHFTSAHMAAFNKVVAGAMFSLDVKMFDASNERPLKLS